MSPAKGLYIHTFGCQMNVHDSEKMSGLLGAHGYAPVDVPEDADLLIYNTCTIRQKAHHKAESELGRVRVYKARRPGMLVAVCGCVAQEEGEALFDRFGEVDILFGPDQIHRLPELIETARARGRASALNLIDEASRYTFINGDVGGRAGTPSAFVSIMKGCNSACSYCIVPSVRGREVCRPSAEIVAEVARRAEEGTREVVLLGQNVNAYRTDIDFATLIARIAGETEIARIRFTSPHPKDVDGALVRQYAENEKLMPHIHLPVQSGSTPVLRRMRRGYTRERYLSVVNDLLRARPGMAISTDLITGFCGETHAEFEETLTLLREVRFSAAFAFMYSPRPGTEAMEKWSDDVVREEKERRLQQILELQKSLTGEANHDKVGRVLDVLVTGWDPKGKGFISGRSPDNTIVHTAGDSTLIGRVVRMTIVAAHANSVCGEVVE